VKLGNALNQFISRGFSGYGTAVFDGAQIGQGLLEQAECRSDLRRLHRDLAKHMFRKATDKLTRSDPFPHFVGVRKVLPGCHQSALLIDGCSYPGIQNWNVGPLPR
jgi:hypothetical protein